MNNFSPSLPWRPWRPSREFSSAYVRLTHAGTFSSTKDTRGISSDSVLSVPSGKSYFEVRVERNEDTASAHGGRRLPDGLLELLATVLQFASMPFGFLTALSIVGTDPFRPLHAGFESV